MRKSRGLSILYAAAIVAGAISAMCFMVQGGFGGGHGDWDVVLWELSLPWTLICWPNVIQSSDFVRLTLLPFFLNVLSITVTRGVLTLLERSRSAADV
jgi:hypothetical protein